MMIRLIDILKEIFDGSDIEYDVEDLSNGKTYKFDFSEQIYCVYFSKDKNYDDEYHVYDVTFARKNDITNKWEYCLLSDKKTSAIRIFGIIVNIIKEFLNNKDVWYLSFSAREKKRMKLYKSMIDKLKDSIGLEDFSGQDWVVKTKYAGYPFMLGKKNIKSN